MRKAPSKEILKCKHGTRVRVLSFCAPSEGYDGYWVTSAGKKWLDSMKKHGALIHQHNTSFYGRVFFSPNRGFTGGLTPAKPSGDVSGWVFVVNARVIPWVDGEEEVNVDCRRGGRREQYVRSSR